MNRLPPGAAQGRWDPEYCTTKMQAQEAESYAEVRGRSTALCPSELYEGMDDPARKHGPEGNLPALLDL